MNETRAVTVTLKLETDVALEKLRDRFAWQTGADKFVAAGDELIVVTEAEVTEPKRKRAKAGLKALLVALLLLIPAAVSAQETQVSAVFVLKQQTRLGYEPASVGVKIEGVYKLNEQWVILGSASGFHSPKLDSGTGKSGFLTLGTRWAPIKIKEVRIFGEFDAILGALVTDPYRKTVFHFRNAIGVKLLDGRVVG